MAFDFEATFASASTDITTYTQIPGIFARGIYNQQSPLQVLAVTGWGEAGATSPASLEVVIYDSENDRVVWSEAGTITPGSSRTILPDNSGATFIGLVEFDTTGRNTVDMILSADKSNLVPMIGVTDLGSYTSLTLAGFGSSVT